MAKKKGKHESTAGLLPVRRDAVVPNDRAEPASPLIGGETLLAFR